MNIYLTTDTHFGHEAMHQYCNRPVGFEELIVKGFRQLTPNDLLIHLGDVCIGNDEKWHRKYIKLLPCKKVLVKGNHDRKSNKWYLENGWDFVCGSFKDTYFGKPVIFSHEPIMILGGALNIHGHFHTDLHNEISPNHKHLSLEKNDYKLFNLKKLLA